MVKMGNMNFLKIFIVSHSKKYVTVIQFIKEAFKNASLIINIHNMVVLIWIRIWIDSIATVFAIRTVVA